MEETRSPTASDAPGGKIVTDLAATDDAGVVPAESTVRSTSMNGVVPVAATNGPSNPHNLEKYKIDSQRVGKTKHWSDTVLAGLVVVLVLVNLAWLLWVVVLTVQPTKTINSIMNTRDFDYGTFWLMYEPSRSIVAVGVAGLACVAVGYLIVLYEVLPLMRRRVRTEERASRSLSSKVLSKALRSAGSMRTSRTESIQRVASKIAMEMANRESKTRRTIAVVAKVSEITMQCVIIAQLLEAGIPPSLCGLFTAIVMLNAVISCVFCLLPHDNMGGVHILTDTAVDFAVAIAFPVVQVLYAQQLFTFDRSLFEINQQIFPPGFFERTEITIADPTEVDAIRHVIDSVRIDSVIKIFTRVGTNASLLFHCTRLTSLLRARRAKVVVYPNEYPKKNYFLAALFGAVAILIVVFTEASLRTSREACAMHPECVQYAHRWIIGRDQDDLARCPCIALIDRDLTLASFDDWVQPPNRTEKVAQLASPGRLETLQLVNRGLQIIPEQLRGCKHLKHVSLYYTNTETLPDWFGELTELQFIQIEGKESGPTPQKSLLSLPEKLFDKMDSLLFLHLALHKLRTLPSLDGLVTIRSISLAILFELEALPSLDQLRNLERLLIYSIPSVQTFPELDKLNKLNALVLGERGAFCCNGFLGADRCNLTHPLCTYHRLSGTPAVTQCLSGADKIASTATRATFAKFEASSCDDYAVAPEQIDVPPTRAAMEQCNGMMYRQCGVPGYGFGMCYNPRWMPVSCNGSPFAMEMRRRQIAQKLGKPCDPEHEAWLGC